MNGTPARRPKSAFSETGVRIKEVSEGRPCDNCPELCPGFIPHAWRYNRVDRNCRRKRSAYAFINTLSNDTSHRADVYEMCLRLKQFTLTDIYTNMADKPEKERKIQKFPSRERNHAVRRKQTNNNFRPHVNCQDCDKVAEREKNQNG